MEQSNAAKVYNDLAGRAREMLRFPLLAAPPKPAATFREIEGFLDYGCAGIRAYLLNVDGHPNQPGKGAHALTSRVLEIGYAVDGTVNRIVTKNTIYILEG